MANLSTIKTHGWSFEYAKVMREHDYLLQLLAMAESRVVPVAITDSRYEKTMVILVGNRDGDEAVDCKGKIDTSSLWFTQATSADTDMIMTGGSFTLHKMPPNYIGAYIFDARKSTLICLDYTRFSHPHIQAIVNNSSVSLAETEFQENVHHWIDTVIKRHFPVNPRVLWDVRHDISLLTPVRPLHIPTTPDADAAARLLEMTGLDNT